jgi:protein TonB
MSAAMAYADSNRRDRIVAAAIAGAIQAALIYALITGLGWHPRTGADEALQVFSVAPPAPPPPRAIPARQKTRRPEGAAAPRSLRSTATEVVAPPPLIPLPVLTPLVAAPVANTGAAATQGASDLPGPGTGAGGYGTGFGSGGSGDGDGSGYEDETPPRWKKGRIKDSDYPRAAGESGAGGTVSVRYRIELDGRVTGCVITRSSGNAVLDETTCRLIEQRFRYDPSRDARGRPVISYIVRDNEWVIDRRDDNRR